MDYQRLSKMRSTYVGHPAVTDEVGKLIEEATGFWQYIYEGKIHPSFLLHRTVTGRSSSADPNAQNFPKRGRGSMKEVVKAFRRVFRAPEGWKLIECDLSQIELRIAAWMANERTMIELYCNGADIHAATAARSMGISLTEFMSLPDDERAFRRFQAKSIPIKVRLLHLDIFSGKPKAQASMYTKSDAALGIYLIRCYICPSTFR